MAKGDADPSGFLNGPGEMSEQRERDPFHRVWYAPGFSFARYEKIAIAAVDTTHLRKMGVWSQISLATPRVEGDVRELAVELREKVVEAIRSHPNGNIEVVEDAGKNGLTLEIALIEVVPNKAWLGTIGLAAWGSPIIPLGVAAGTAAAMVDRGWVSIEARVREGCTNRILFQFADSETGKTRIVDLEVLTWYGHVHEIFDDWARQFAQRANTPFEQPVSETSWFTLRPW